MSTSLDCVTPLCLSANNDSARNLYPRYSHCISPFSTHNKLLIKVPTCVCAFIFLNCVSICTLTGTRLHAVVIQSYIKGAHKVASGSLCSSLIALSKRLFGAFMLTTPLTFFFYCAPQPGTVLIMKGQEEAGRDQPLSQVIHPPPPSSKPRYGDGTARRTSPSTGNKGAAGQEGEFPCKKCGRSVIRNIPSVTAVVLETLAWLCLLTQSSQQQSLELHKWP